MDKETMNSDDSYSDDDEEEELDPRIQDELEKLNAATNSINHLEAELDEARAVFRQTLAGATYHLNGVAQKLGKCVDKSRPFYEAYRQLRQSHGHLQKSTNQFERATGMHIAAKSRVMEAEKRVFGAGPQRAFDTALQEMLNQATMEVNEAEKLKRDSWKQHQEDLKAYRDLEFKVKKLYKKLKSSVDKAKPYFEQKREFDRHLWQLKLRVDSILIGLSGAKENYSACLKSLEVISDDIHEKRKSKRMETMFSKLQERESGVGADSSTEDETSLHASNLDLDFDSSLNFDKLDDLSDDLADCDISTTRLAASCSDLEKMSASCSFPDGGNSPSDTRVVYGLESSDSDYNKELKEQTIDEDNSNEHLKENDTKNEIEQTENDSVASQESTVIMINQLGLSDKLEPNNESKRDESSVAGERGPRDLLNQEKTIVNKSSVAEEGSAQDETGLDEDKMSDGKEQSCQEQLRRDELTTRDESCADEDRTCHDESPQTDESSALEETPQNQALDDEPTAKDQSNDSAENAPQNQALDDEPTAKDQSNDSAENAPQDQASHEEVPQTDESTVSAETSQNHALVDNDNAESSSQEKASHDELTTTDESHVMKETP